MRVIRWRACVGRPDLLVLLGEEKRTGVRFPCVVTLVGAGRGRRRAVGTACDDSADELLVRACGVCPLERHRWLAAMRVMHVGGSIVDV